MTLALKKRLVPGHLANTSSFSSNAILAAAGAGVAAAAAFLEGDALAGVLAVDLRPLEAVRGMFCKKVGENIHACILAFVLRYTLYSFHIAAKK